MQRYSGTNSSSASSMIDTLPVAHIPATFQSSRNFSWLARDLDAQQVGALAFVRDAAEVGVGRPQRIAAEGPRAAGDDPAALGPTGTAPGRREMARARDPRADPGVAVDLFDHAWAATGRQPVGRGPDPDAPAGRSRPTSTLPRSRRVAGARTARSRHTQPGCRFEHPSGVEVGDGFVGVPTRALGVGRPLAQGRPEGADLLEDRRRAVPTCRGMQSSAVSPGLKARAPLTPAACELSRIVKASDITTPSPG